MRAQTIRFPYWLLIGTIALVLALGGCNAPRTTAKVQTFSQLQKRLAEEKVKEQAVPVSEKEEKSVAALNDEDKAADPAPERKLLTLREQMKKIGDEQESIRRQQENITSEVVTTKQDIAKIKESIEDIKDVLRQMQTGHPATAVRGLSPDEKIPGKGESVQPKKSGSIMPDNTIRLEEAKAKTIAKNNVIMPDNAPKAAPKKKTAAINPDLAARYEGQSSTTPKKKAVIAADPLPVPAKTQPAAAEAQGTQEKYQTAMNLLNRKKYSEVIPILEEVVKKERNPVTLSNSYYWLGESYFGTQNYDQALSHFMKVLSIKSAPRRDSAQVFIAECYSKKGNIAEARKNYQKVIDGFPTSEHVPRAKKMLQLL